MLGEELSSCVVLFTNMWAWSLPLPPPYAFFPVALFSDDSVQTGCIRKQTQVLAGILLELMVENHHGIILKLFEDDFLDQGIKVY
jgi:hypothetical protein